MAIASSTTSNRKSSQYHNRKPPYSPSIKSDAVSYIYDQNSNNAAVISKSHANIVKQDSSMSRQMLLKQDSSVSRQLLLKQDSAGSRQLLIKQESSTGGVSRQDSNASSRELIFCHQSSLASSIHPLLGKQDSDGSIRAGKLLLRQDTRCSAGAETKPDSYISNVEPSYKGVNVVVAEVSRGPEWTPSLVDNLCSRKNVLCRQDSIVSFGEIRRHQLVKQDSVVSFAEPKLGASFNKQVPTSIYIYIIIQYNSLQNMCETLIWSSRTLSFRSLINGPVAAGSFPNRTRSSSTIQYRRIDLETGRMCRS